MNRSDAAQLLTIAAAADRRTIGDADVLAWAELLHDVDFDDARQAVREHYRNSRDWLMPADVRKRVKTIRDERLARRPVDAPTGEGITDDPRRYRASLQSEIRRIADGYAPPAIERTEPPAQITDRRGRDELRVRSLPVACPWCHARPGARCVNAAGDPLAANPAHDARLVATGLAQWTGGPYQHATPVTEQAS